MIPVSPTAVRFNIYDVTLHANAICRNCDQIIPTTRRVLYAANIKSALRFMVAVCEIQWSEVTVGCIYGVLNTHRGHTFEKA